MMRKDYKSGVIEIKASGVLVLPGWISVDEYYTNIEVMELGENGLYQITAQKVLFRASLEKNYDVDFSNVWEKDIQEEKPTFWNRYKKRKYVQGYYRLLKTEPIMITTSNITIKEKT